MNSSTGVLYRKQLISLIVVAMVVVMMVIAAGIVMAGAQGKTGCGRGRLGSTMVVVGRVVGGVAVIVPLCVSIVGLVVVGVVVIVVVVHGS